MDESPTPESASIAVGMTPFDEIATLALGLGVPAGGFFACAGALRLVSRRRDLPCAAEGLSARLGLSLAPLEGAELAGLLSGGVLSNGVRTSSAVRWEAPDATFCALVVAGSRGPEGLVVVTPHGARTAKPRLADALRRSPRALAALALPGDLALRAPDVSATRLGERLVVRRPNVQTADDLERLVMCACAVLDAA